MVDRENLYFRTNKYRYNFQNFWTINTFDRDIYNSKVNLKEADEDKSSLLVEILKIRKQVKPKNPEKKTKEKRCYWKLI